MLEALAPATVPPLATTFEAVAATAVSVACVIMGPASTTDLVAGVSARAFALNMLTLVFRNSFKYLFTS